MKFIGSLIAFASLAAAAPQAGTSLDVKLEMAGNSAVRATIINSGKTNLKIFKTGTILDEAPIQKAHITRDDERETEVAELRKSVGNKVRFRGIRQRIATQNLDDAAFEHIPAGDSVEVVFNVGEVHDLSAGGAVNIHSSGVMHFANPDNNELAGSIPYTSNIVRTTIDGPEAASLLKSFHAERRSVVQGDCGGSKYSASETALDDCVKIARLAQSAANSNAQKVMEYFKDVSDSTKQDIASVYDRVADECSSGNRSTRYFCSDIQGNCAKNVLAYTVTDQDYQVYCDLYFNLPSVTYTCHAQDQATTVLHEMTHLAEVADTSDMAYGYNNIMKLDSYSALHNADSYSLFANAIVAGC
ncbi:hypothetical protein E4U43_008507 [Claviceps pusilla]|uniref:Neutral protease 2 n=1 Tax=Claviceps pusilla TaxID=123648 RepID=A0A9P7SZM7_9HYPO|nr:hypothetical protein E4U43_008507 [Claviceps pusilla]